MNLIGLAEIGVVPDWVVRIGIRRMLRQRLRREYGRVESCRSVSCPSVPIAIATEQANAQHYELPTEFFEWVLGPRLKYSCGLYPNEHTTLAEAETHMLRLTCQRAEVADGMDVLDLGCGWGALALWIAEHFPNCHVTALSNSATQRQCVEARAAAAGLNNVRVITSDISHYAASARFDRVVSVEMFEHLQNLAALLKRVAGWMTPSGKLFVHHFCHRDLTYPFEANGASDWMARHFFTGGMMPSYDMLERVGDRFVLERKWQINGLHYARTCGDWLRNLDAHCSQIVALFSDHYGKIEAKMRLQRWRMFLMACAELFDYGRGDEWFVAHCLMVPSDCSSSSRSFHSLAASN